LAAALPHDRGFQTGAFVRFIVVLLLLAGCAAGPSAPLASARLHLRDKAPALQDFLIPGQGAAQIRLYSLAANEMTLEPLCDADMTLQRPDHPPERLAAGKGTPFVLPAVSRGRLSLVAAEDVTTCKLRVTPRGAKPYVLNLHREGAARPELLRHDLAPTDCALGPDSADLAGVFRSFEPLALTCPVAPGQIGTHPDAREAFQAKVRALTGRPLPDAMLDQGLATAPIDFSRAPQLDLITLAYLHIRADFAGWVMARMLAFHAARGTVVRILVSEAVMTPRDRAMLEHLAAQYPTIQLQMYRAPGGGAGWLHRVNHVKLFATVSRRPGQSFAMIGGRNLHDGFVFETPRDLSATPWLHTYEESAGASLYFFNSYKDFEISLRNDAAVRRVSEHVSRFWQRDAVTGALPDRPVQRPVRDAGARLRHFLSMPQIDGRALERLYVEVFDRAQREIQMTSPFLNLPPALEAAMVRALDRGVRIELVSRIEMPDPSAFLATTLNRMFIRKHGARMKIWAHPAEPSTLHAKYLLIDGEMAIVTSTNLNRRSFAHDTENGVLILDRAEVARLRLAFEALKAASIPVGPDVPVNAVREGLIRLPFLRDVF
jgi:phosphatidylserine/phosphatidylglycerophosphate/cardiolipin synthase-like enzyme